MLTFMGILWAIKIPIGVGPQFKLTHYPLYVGQSNRPFAGHPGSSGRSPGEGILFPAYAMFGLHARSGIRAAAFVFRIRQIPAPWHRRRQPLTTNCACRVLPLRPRTYDAGTSAAHLPVDLKREVA
jgi:hypothetical protein